MIGLPITTYEELRNALNSIPEERLKDNITFLFDGEFSGKSYDLFFSDENNDELDIGHPYLIEIVSW